MDQLVRILRSKDCKWIITNSCDKHIDEVLKKLSKQQDRERSLIYGNMM